MTSVLRFACAGLLLTAALPALAMEDTPQNRAQEASRYLLSVPPGMVVAGMAQRMASSMPPQQQQAFMAAMQRNVNMAGINATAQAGLVKVFTAGELRALADFYGSPLGKSATGKMSSYMSEVMPTIMKEVQAAAAKSQQETGQQQK